MTVSLNKYCGIYKFQNLNSVNKNDKILITQNENSLYVIISQNNEEKKHQLINIGPNFYKTYDNKVQILFNQASTISFSLVLTYNGVTKTYKRIVLNRTTLIQKIKLNIKSFLIAILVVLLLIFGFALFKYIQNSLPPLLKIDEVKSEKSCIKGNVDNCKRVLQYYNSIHYFKKNLEILNKSCANNSNEEIYILKANLLINTSSNNDELISFLQNACLKKEMGKTCYLLANNISDKSELFLKAIKKGCLLESPKSCNLFFYNFNKITSLEQTIKIAKSSCEKKLGYSCKRLKQLTRLKRDRNLCYNKNQKKSCNDLHANLNDFQHAKMYNDVRKKLNLR